MMRREEEEAVTWSKEKCEERNGGSMRRLKRGYLNVAKE